MKKLIALTALAVIGSGVLYARGYQNNSQNGYGGFGGACCGFGGGFGGGGRGMMGGGFGGGRGTIQDDTVARAVMASRGMKEADITKMLQLRKEMTGLMDKYYAQTNQ